MINQTGNNSKGMNLLIGLSLVLNISYLSYKFYTIYKEANKRKDCQCKEK